MLPSFVHNQPYALTVPSNKKAALRWHSLTLHFTLGFYLRFPLIVYQLEGIECFEGCNMSA